MARPHPRAPRALRTASRTALTSGTDARAATRGADRAHAGTPSLRGLGGFASTVAVLLVLSGCSGGGDAAGGAADESAAGAAAAPRSTVASGADCLAPQVLADLGFDPAAYTGARHPEVPDAVAVPAGFVAESAVRCSTGETLTDTSGTWAAVTASRLEGDVRPLVEALTARSTLPATGTVPTCAAGVDRTELWLVDALGSAVRVVVPGAGCEPLPATLADGLEVLEAVDVEHYPVALVLPRPGASTGPTG